MKFKAFTFLRAIRISLVVALAPAMLSAITTSAQAAPAPPTLVDCGTSGTFTIVGTTVTTDTLCVGSLTIPEGVVEIAQDAFNRAPAKSSYITSIIFPNSLTTIAQSAFRMATQLESISFGTGLQSISHWNFADSTMLTAVTIPSSVVSIGTGAFYGSSNLDSVTFLGSAPSYGGNTFNGMKAGAKAYVNSPSPGFGAYGSTWSYLIVAGAAPTPTLSLAKSDLTSNSVTLTATTSVEGSVDFTIAGTSIDGCSSVATSSLVAVCTWQASTSGGTQAGELTATATLTPTGTTSDGTIFDTQSFTIVTQTLTTSTPTVLITPVVPVAPGVAGAVIRSLQTITLTAAMAGRVAFTQDGRSIPGCTAIRTITSGTTTAVCLWHPSKFGTVSIVATLTPTNRAYLSVKSQPILLAIKPRT